MRFMVAVRELVLSLVTYRNSASKPRLQTSCPELDSVTGQLETMNRSTEQDFLAIGARLMEFLQSASAIAAGIDNIVRSTAGEHGATAATTLTHALDRCHRLVANASADRMHLASLREGAVRVGSVFGGFRQAVASFHVVCTMTRVEAARLGGAGDELGSLTDEVLTLARRMQAQVEHVLDAAAAVHGQVAHLATSLRGTNQLLDHLALIIPNVLRNLDVFSAQKLAASELSVQLAQDSRAVSRSIMNAVTSIQFHDITRQQIEHIIAALRHLSSRGTGAGLPHNATAAVHLEAKQLASAGDTFGRSVARLWHDLEGLAASVHGMTDKGNALVSSHGDDSVFFLDLQHCLDAIAAAVTSHHDAKASTYSAALDLAATLNTMNAAATEIRELDVQLLRVALNANIRAAHLGPRGDTLAILASTLQDLAASADERSRQATAALDTMGSAVSLLVAPHDAEDDTSLTGNMRTTMDTLKAASEESSARLREITSSASLLGDGIASERENFHAGRIVEEAVSTCLALLHEIAAKASNAAPACDHDGVLETFEQRYTMQSERDIHASVAEGAPSAPLLVIAGDHVFGDDIELF
jgi:hypothetical protein